MNDTDMRPIRPLESAVSGYGTLTVPAEDVRRRMERVQGRGYLSITRYRGTQPLACEMLACGESVAFVLGGSRYVCTDDAVFLHTCRILDARQVAEHTRGGRP